MNNTIRTLVLALTTVIGLSSCTALRGDYGKPLTQEEDRRLRAGEVTGTERRLFCTERELTPEQKVIIDHGPPVYQHTDYGDVKIAGSYINWASVQETYLKQQAALGRALSQQ